jgi:hypothetical protein
MTSSENDYGGSRPYDNGATGSIQGVSLEVDVEEAIAARRRFWFDEGRFRSAPEHDPECDHAAATTSAPLTGAERARVLRGRGSLLESPRRAELLEPHRRADQQESPRPFSVPPGLESEAGGTERGRAPGDARRREHRSDRTK